MSRNSRYLKSLEIINNIDEECSEFSEEELSESEVDNIEQHDDSFDNTSRSESTGKESEKENILNRRRVQKRKRPLLSSESESDVEEQCIEIAADGTKWEEIEHGSTPGRTPIHNIFRDVAGPTGYSKRNIMKGKVRSAFSLLIDNRVMEHIRKCTEEEASRVLGTKWNLTPAKLNAFIALLYARGAYEANNLNISYLWNKKWGPDFFSRTMSRNDFCEIMRFIRFDKKSQRSQRLQTDKFALISEVWYKFIENSQNCYKPGAHITIDEQLFPTKARCRFTQYMPKKPDKFGIKFWLASDVETKYVINGFPYLGKDENRESSAPLGEFVVLKLLEPFTGCGRSVTTENFFTSASLAAKKTTIVGTIRRNKRELPKFAKQAKDGMPRFSTKLYKSDHCTLTVYKSKPKKKVLLLSSKHKSIDIEKSGKRIPETIRFYNSTKFGVDMTDQMARKYTVKSKSQRWTAQVFFNTLDLAGINSWVLYRETTGEKISRQQFLFQLAEELAEDFQHEQQEKQENIQETSTNSSSVSCVRMRKRCQINFCKENKTTKICFKCKKYVCGKCSFENPLICKICGEHE